MAAKKVACDCGKVMRAEDDSELIATVQRRATEFHNMTLSSEQILSMAEPA